MLDPLLTILDLMGTIVFAITGLLAASRHQLDLFGAIVLAMVTAVGGGTLRDLILNVPVFWLTHTEYIYIIVATTLMVAFYRRAHVIPVQVLLLLDAIGLAVFSIIGAQKALSLGFADVIAVMMGIMTGVVGGMIRDVLVGEVPLILRKEIYATASFLGASVYVVAVSFSSIAWFAILLSMTATLVARLGGVFLGWRLPKFITT
ncbi:MAG: trimeric intracellular cation channel family protein [Proteobacteria bacterium]|nr:trimeric intracellular cation channel family protein [Pseudomonadota bacterium]